LPTMQIVAILVDAVILSPFHSLFMIKDQTWE